LDQIVLAGGTASVITHLSQGGLADVDKCLPVEMVRPDFGVVDGDFAWSGSLANQPDWSAIKSKAN